jgi:flagellar basal body-associated protein FliL
LEPSRVTSAYLTTGGTKLGILWIILIVILVLALLGFFGRGRF